jgi:hypothetical protein
MIIGEQDGIYALGLQSDGVDVFSAKLEKLFGKINMEAHHAIRLF